MTSEAVGAPNTSSGGQTVSFQRTVSGQLVPVTVKQTKITEHGVASQLPPHLLQQMYAGKCHSPQLMTAVAGLYGANCSLEDCLIIWRSYICRVSANPQAQTLYGGRMTQARLREVGSVTAEAIEGLHK